MTDPLRLIISLDVEEEGLFGGHYERDCPSVRNVSSLEALAQLLEEFAFPATLFCAYSVFSQTPACAVLERLRDRNGMEIAAHLHHWNTPPLLPLPPASVSTALLPLQLFDDKLGTLLEAGRKFQGAPLTSFRMGRWDLRAAHWEVLARHGILADASVRPLHCGGALPDHFDAPNEPYTVRVGERRILELPLTCTPLLSALPAWLHAGSAPGKAAPWQRCARATLKTWGVLALLPVYHPLWAMKAITRLYIARGGRTLSLTWHSSEMMPGGAPHIPNQQSVDTLLAKIRSWLRWLTRNWTVEGLTLEGLRHAVPAAVPCSSGTGDWLPPATL